MEDRGNRNRRFFFSSWYTVNGLNLSSTRTEKNREKFTECAYFFSEECEGVYYITDKSR